MVKLITVHGTFAGDPSDHGKKWWQKGSYFLGELQELIDDELDIEPFHWSGDNSEVDRRKTGARLARAIDRCKEPPIVIGHSHGGSVVIQALALLYLKQKKKCCDYVRAFFSVGTPMLVFRSNRNPISWFDVRGRLLLVIALGVLGLLAAEVSSEFYVGTGENLLIGLREFFITPQFGVAMGVGLLLLAYSWRNIQRGRLFKSNKLYKLFSDRTVALNHTADEAINGLKRIKKISPKIIRFPMVFTGLFSGLSIAFVAAFFIYNVASIAGMLPEQAGFAYEFLETNLFAPLETRIVNQFFDEVGLANDPTLVEYAGYFQATTIIAVLLAAALIAALVALVSTPMLSHLVNEQLKSQSFGDDGYGETVRAVHPGLNFEATEIGTLPKDVEDQMIEASRYDAADALVRLRELLSSGSLVDADGADLMAQATKFEKSELLHNAYFFSPLFARFVAAWLVERFGLRPSAVFQADPDAQQFLVAVRRSSTSS